MVATYLNYSYSLYITHQNHSYATFIYILFPICMCVCYQHPIRHKLLNYVALDTSAENRPTKANPDMS